MSAEVPIRPLRLLLVLTLASMVVGMVMTGTSFFAEKAPSTRQFAVAGFILGTSWLLWLAGAVAVAVRIQRGAVRRIEIQLLGAALAGIHPLMAMLAVQYAMPFLMPGVAGPARPVETPVLACLELGLGQVPFGWFGAWILWRMGFPGLASKFAPGLKSRRWEYIGRARLILFLFLAPMPAGMVVSVFFFAAKRDGAARAGRRNRRDRDGGIGAISPRPGYCSGWCWRRCLRLRSAG
jgi:hypothetical protein